MNNKYIGKIMTNLHETGKNKLCAILLVAMGIIAAEIDGDATGLIFLSCMALPLFFTKKNFIY